MNRKEIIKVNANSLKSYDNKKFNPKTIYQSDQIRVILAYFKKGQFIPVHTPDIDLVLCMLEGEAELVAGEGRIIASLSDIIIIPKGIKRGIRALTDLMILHIVQPPPSDEDHKEVHQKLAAGKFD